jgi:hypothetical protein
VNADKLANGAVRSDKLANGAVKPWHIGMYGRVAFVAPAGGDYDNPADAMNSYQTWCGTPSESNPCLLKIMPGLYDIGTAEIFMRSYIDIEGSGIDITKIVGNGGNVFYGSSVSHAELRSLSLENTSTANQAFGVYLYTSSPRLTDLDISVLDAGSSKGLIVIYGSPWIQRVNVDVAGSTYGDGIIAYFVSGRWIDFSISASASGESSYATGVTLSSDSEVMIQNSHVEATSSYFGCAFRIGGGAATFKSGSMYASGVDTTYGVLAEDGTIEINDSVLQGMIYAYKEISGSSGVVLVGNSKMVGGVSGKGVVRCAGVYDENYTFYANSCPQ